MSFVDVEVMNPDLSALRPPPQDPDKLWDVDVSLAGRVDQSLLEVVEEFFESHTLLCVKVKSTDGLPRHIEEVDGRNRCTVQITHLAITRHRLRWIYPIPH